MDLNYDSVYMYWSIDGYPNLVKGSLSFIPNAVNELKAQVESFPDSSTVATLQSIGVRTVVLHLDRIAGTPWQDAPDRTITGLPVTERRSGSVIIYTIAAR
jgi:hypothetical protein